MHINSVFMVLTQLGIGPDRGFTIKDDSAIWADFVPEEPVLEAVKSFVYLKVKLLFDPPLNSSVIESMNRQISEFEWRINIAAERACHQGKNRPVTLSLCADARTDNRSRRHLQESGILPIRRYTVFGAALFV